MRKILTVLGLPALVIAAALGFSMASSPAAHATTYTQWNFLGVGADDCVQEVSGFAVLNACGTGNSFNWAAEQITSGTYAGDYHLVSQGDSECAYNQGNNKRVALEQCGSDASQAWEAVTVINGGSFPDAWLSSDGSNYVNDWGNTFGCSLGAGNWQVTETSGYVNGTCNDYSGPGTS